MCYWAISSCLLLWNKTSLFQPCMTFEDLFIQCVSSICFLHPDIFPVFLVSHPDCNERGCFWFPPVLLQTEALAAFVLPPLLWAEVKQPKTRDSTACFMLFVHQAAVGCRDGRLHVMFLSWSPACRKHTAAIPSAGGVSLRDRSKLHQ